MKPAKYHRQQPEQMRSIPFEENDDDSFGDKVAGWVCLFVFVSIIILAN